MYTQVVLHICVQYVYMKMFLRVSGDQLSQHRPQNSGAPIRRTHRTWNHQFVETAICSVWSPDMKATGHTLPYHILCIAEPQQKNMVCLATYKGFRRLSYIHLGLSLSMYIHLCIDMHRYIYIYCPPTLLPMPGAKQVHINTRILQTMVS